MKQIFILICLIGTLVIPYLVFAQSGPREVLRNVATQDGAYADITGGQETIKFAEIIGTIISTILGFLGVIFLILIILGGFRWMTAAGNEEQVNEALAIIRRAAIGLLIVVSSYGIWELVNNVLSS